MHTTHVEEASPLPTDPHATLEAKYIGEYLRRKGYSLEGLAKLSEEKAKKLLTEASLFASLKLAELEMGAVFVGKTSTIGNAFQQQSIAPGGARTMNKTALQGKLRQIRGGMKTRWGRLTDDDRRMLDGKIDQMVGLFQERYGYTQEHAAHALTHYLGSYGKRGRHQTGGLVRNWRPVFAAVGFLTLITAGWFGFTRLLATRREQEFAGQEAVASPELQFD